jgi:hypothetical protein
MTSVPSAGSLKSRSFPRVGFLPFGKPDQLAKVTNKRQLFGASGTVLCACDAQNGQCFIKKMVWCLMSIFVGNGEIVATFAFWMFDVTIRASDGLCATN